MPQALSTDILIVGGGITGLWLNVRLRRADYAIALVENTSFGGGQSMRSQGVIHGGTKYTLHSALTSASEAIADMPQRWHACLGSGGELNLWGVRLLFEMHYLWSPGGLIGSLTSLFTSKTIRSRVKQVKGESLPPTLRDKGFKGKVCRLTEIVFDVPGLIRCLAKLAGDGLLTGECIEPLREDRKLTGLCVDSREIRAQRVVLSAGVGNEALLRELDPGQPATQRRPLHMVTIKTTILKPSYAHCLGTGPKPRVTVTTHPTRDGQSVWYLGGDIAETDGVIRDEVAQIVETRRELTKLLPQIDLGQTQWATLRINRAEPAQSGLLHPDNAFLAEQGHPLVGWPTKLALTLNFADRVCIHLGEDGIRPSEHATLP